MDLRHSPSLSTGGDESGRQESATKRAWDVQLGMAVFTDIYLQAV